MSKKCYAYLRVSSQSQLAGDGFDRQMENISKYCKINGLEIVGEFQEQGVSGIKDETDRPAFKQMIGEILRNGVSIIVVESLDRLAREYRIQEQLLIYLVSKGIDLLSANTGENVTQAIQEDPMRKAMVQIQGIFSELDKSLLVNKLSKARERIRQEKGKCEGAKRYGENSEEEAAIVNKIRLMRRKRRGGRKGMSLQAIANRLNREGIPTKRGKEWTPMTVKRALESR
jgi:site-specific DNA recombinase